MQPSYCKQAQHSVMRLQPQSIHSPRLCYKILYDGRVLITCPFNIFYILDLQNSKISVVSVLVVLRIGLYIFRVTLF